MKGGGAAGVATLGAAGVEGGATGSDRDADRNPAAGTVSRRAAVGVHRCRARWDRGHHLRAARRLAPGGSDDRHLASAGSPRARGCGRRCAMAPSSSPCSCSCFRFGGPASVPDASPSDLRPRRRPMMSNEGCSRRQRVALRDRNDLVERFARRAVLTLAASGRVHLSSGTAMSFRARACSIFCHACCSDDESRRCSGSGACEVFQKFAAVHASVLKPLQPGAKASPADTSSRHTAPPLSSSGVGLCAAIRDSHTALGETGSNPSGITRLTVPDRMNRCVLPRRFDDARSDLKAPVSNGTLARLHRFHDIKRN